MNTVINSHTSALRVRKVAALTAAEEAPLFSLSALHHMYGSTEPVASHPPDHEPTHLRSASVSNLLERGVAKFVEGLGVVAPDDLADFGESVLGRSPHTVESADYDLHESQVYAYRNWAAETTGLLPSDSQRASAGVAARSTRPPGRTSGSFARGVRVQESPQKSHAFLEHHDVDDFVPMRSFGGSVASLDGFSASRTPSGRGGDDDDDSDDGECVYVRASESRSLPAQRGAHNRVSSASLDDKHYVVDGFIARAARSRRMRHGSFSSGNFDLDASEIGSQPSIYGYKAENFVVGVCRRCEQCCGWCNRRCPSWGASNDSLAHIDRNRSLRFEGSAACTRCVVVEVCRCHTLRNVAWRVCCCGGHGLDPHDRHQHVMRRRVACWRWTLTIGVGVAVAFVAFVIKNGVKWGRRMRNLVFALTMGGLEGSSAHCFQYADHDFGGNVPGADNRTIWTHFNPWIEAANGFEVGANDQMDAFKVNWAGLPIFTRFTSCTPFLLFDAIVFVTVCCLLALVATSFVVSPCCGESLAAGSGITEIKAFLNGIKVPRVVRFKTMVTKTLGLIFAVVSGLPVGKEGPMIHSGAIIGAGLSQGKSSTSLACCVSKNCVCDTRWTVFADFRNDREKRDFVACGAAAGVAAAFGAPIGGVLFVLEEGASYWSQLLTFRTFACALSALWVLSLLDSLVEREADAVTVFQRLDNIGAAAGSFSFGQFSSDQCSLEREIGTNVTSLKVAKQIEDERHWKVWEVPIFVLLGAIGGVLGAGFNAANSAIARWRRRWIEIDVPLTHNTRPDAAKVRDQERASGLEGSALHSVLLDSSSTQQNTHHNAQLRAAGMRAAGRCGCRRARWMCCWGPAQCACSAPCLPRGWPSQYIEVVVLSLLVTLSGYVLSQVFGHCRRLDPTKCGRIFGEVPNGTSSKLGGIGYLDVAPTALCPSPVVLQRFNCPEGGWYNDIASLWFAETAENAVHQLFHLSNSSVDLDSTDYASPNFYMNAVEYHLGLRIFAFCAPLYVLTCCVYGARVPAGLFVPNILVGAGLGRLAFFALMWMFENPAFAWMDLKPSSQGIYALVGAASVLGGMARMALSLTAILLECTGGYAFALPLALALFTARFFGNIFNEGIYDIYMEHNGWPFLESKPPKAATIRAARGYKLPSALILSKNASADNVGRFKLLNVLRVRHVMASNPVCLRRIERVGNVLMALKMTTHNGFPVVFDPRIVQQREVHGAGSSADDAGASPRAGGGVRQAPLRRFAGLVLRQQLLVLLDNHWWGQHPDPERRGLPGVVNLADRHGGHSRLELGGNVSGNSVVSGKNVQLREAIAREARAGSRFTSSTTGEDLDEDDIKQKDPLRQELFDVRYPRFPNLDLLQQEICYEQRWHCWIDLRPCVRVHRAHVTTPPPPSRLTRISHFSCISFPHPLQIHQHHVPHRAGRYAVRARIHAVPNAWAAPSRCARCTAKGERCAWERGQQQESRRESRAGCNGGRDTLGSNDASRQGSHCAASPRRHRGASARGRCRRCWHRGCEAAFANDAVKYYYNVRVRVKKLTSIRK